MNAKSAAGIRLLSWSGTGMAILSLLAIQSWAGQIIFLSLGSLFFILSAQRIAKLEAFSAHVPKNVPFYLAIASAIACLVRFSILTLTSIPAQHGEYVSRNQNPMVTFVASNTGFFYIFSLVLLFGMALATLVFLSIPTREKTREALS
ncbi:MULTISPECIES: hypothetical protein [Micrococcaceae]|uniref:hypothetical protein n=1 Tax=Micrococcaceae TaxID=1268 RepID=UPI0011412712|nr:MULTISPECIES: hypothetical protein [Micrococcaceae]